MECKVSQVWPIYRLFGGDTWEQIEEHLGTLDSAFERCIELNDRTDRQHAVVPPFPGEGHATY